MNAAASSAASAEPSPDRSVGVREMGDQAERIYREVEQTGVPVTVVDEGRPIARIIPLRREETPYERRLREGKIRRAKRPFRLPEERYTLPEGTDLEEFLLGERQEER